MLFVFGFIELILPFVTLELNTCVLLINSESSAITGYPTTYIVCPIENPAVLIGIEGRLKSPSTCITAKSAISVIEVSSNRREIHSTM